ncbi:MAG: hypothetical protein ABEK17_03160 [Candidatus Aenigmatarchaeota archaeon]
MNKKYGILGILVIAGVLFVGSNLVSAYGPQWNQSSEDGTGFRKGMESGEIMDHDDDGTPNRIDQDYERPRDGSNSPWVKEDWRLDRFQERFDLTDSQMGELKTEIQEKINSDASHEEMEEYMESKMKEFGFEDFEPREGRSGRRVGRNSKRRFAHENCPLDE